MRKKQKKCPRCVKRGSGPYVKMTRNRAGGNLYHKYAYFMHKIEKADDSVKTKWCYIGEALAEKTCDGLPNREKELRVNIPKKLPSQQEIDCRRCKYLTTVDGRLFYEWLKSFSTPKIPSQPCDGFKPAQYLCKGSPKRR